MSAMQTRWRELPFHARRGWSRIFQPDRPQSMPEHPACYALLLDGRVVYVGQTVNLQARFAQHQIKHIDEGLFATAWGVLTGELVLKVRFGRTHGDWAMREARLIDRLRPAFNVRGC